MYSSQNIYVLHYGPDHEDSMIFADLDKAYRKLEKQSKNLSNPFRPYIVSYTLQDGVYMRHKYGYKCADASTGVTISEV